MTRSFEVEMNSLPNWPRKREPRPKRERRHLQYPEQTGVRDQEGPSSRVILELQHFAGITPSLCMLECGVANLIGFSWDSYWILMPKSNPARDRDLFRLWQEGETIEEASLLTGIPRSTVGYYYKKYKRYAKEGRPVVIPQATEERPRTEVDPSVLLKSMIIGPTMEMINAGDPQRAYYILGVFKLLKDLNLEFTREEFEALQKSPRPSTWAPLDATTRRTTQTASQSNESTRVATLPVMTMEHPETRKSSLDETISRAIKENPQEFLEVLRRSLAEGKTRP